MTTTDNNCKQHLTIQVVSRQQSLENKVVLKQQRTSWSQSVYCNNNITKNNNRLMALCPGLPGWAGTRRDIHPLMWGCPQGDTCHLL